jgi:hypothetical protein
MKKIILMFAVAVLAATAAWAQGDLIPGQTPAPDDLKQQVMVSLYNRLNSIDGLDDEVKVVSLELTFEGGVVDKDGTYTSKSWGGEAVLSYLTQGHKVHIQVIEDNGRSSWHVDSGELNFLRSY